VAQSPEALRLALPALIEDASNELPGIARLALQRAHLHWVDIDLQIAWCDERIAAHVPSHERVAKAAQLLGIGPVTASALVATVDHFIQFKNARQFGAWLGRISKRGDDYLRTLLIQGWQKAVVALANKNARILWAVMTREQRFDRHHISIKPAGALQPPRGADPSPAAMA